VTPEDPVTPKEVRAQIRVGRTGPLYLLEGDDPQSRHELAQEFTGLVDEGLQAFNVEFFHANEASTASARDEMIGAILGAARTLPMMAPRRVVVVHEADRLLSPRRSKEDEGASPATVEPFAKKRRGTTPAEELEAYFETPEPMTSVVFVSGPLDAGRRLVKGLRRHAAVVDCGSLESAAEAGAWIRKRLERDSLSIGARATALLVEATGLSLAGIRAEVDKLALYAAGESEVTERHVRELVIPQSEPGADFALGRAIWNADAADALREVSAQLDAGAAPPMVLGQIRAAAGRLRPDSKVRMSLDLVLNTDLAIKTSAGDPRHLLERLVIELCGR
jgi:DNA polymerase-3 subunit delta